MTPEFGLIVGGILGDGGIDKRTKRPFYYSSEPNQINGFKKAVLKTFGNADFSFHKSIADVPCIMFPKLIGEILCQVGLEGGNKNYKHFMGIPDIFVENPKNPATVNLIRRLFDDDGTVVNNHNNRCVSLVSPTIFKENEQIVQPKVLLNLKEIFKKFGIESHICDYNISKKENGEIAHYWELRIRSKENLQKFYSQIGFGLSRKQVKLKKVLKRYVEGLEFYPRFHANENYLAIIKKMQNVGVNVSSNSLAKACRRNGRHIRQVLLDLVKMNLVKRELNGNKYHYSLVGVAADG